MRRALGYFAADEGGMMVDLEKLAAVAAGAELPPTVRDAVNELLAADVIDASLPVNVNVVERGRYALVEIR